MNKFQFFWDTMELCDWSHEGDDSQVLRPVIQYLAQQEDDRIFQFDDLMSDFCMGWIPKSWQLSVKQRSPL